MSIPEMRAAISSVYSGDRWKDRVAGMHDGQVIVVYHNFLARNLIGRVVEYESPKGMDRLTEVTDKGIILGFDEAIEQGQARCVQLDLKTILKIKI